MLRYYTGTRFEKCWDIIRELGLRNVGVLYGN